MTLLKANPWEGTMDSYQNSVVLVTGGTGSFGNTLVRHLSDKDCSEIRIFSRDETKQDEMRRKFADLENVRFFLGDVRDRQSVDRAMVNVDLVFHAAALKQVPSCEFFPSEAVSTNIDGSHNVVESARRHEVQAVVLLSTDKAVYPINAMGMTKALMEKIGQAAARELLREKSNTRIMITRYGNVLYSRGSVVPAFIAQIRAGSPLTITDPTMTRFLLPLSDSVTLVEHAWQSGNNGDVFVRKAPACTMANLAQAIQNMFARQVGTTTVGIRHGEKIHETLVSNIELNRAISSPNYFQIPLDDRDLRYSDYFENGSQQPPKEDGYDSSNTVQLNVSEIEALLGSLPELQAVLNK
jgi:UDP-glucose 4-epimerase